MICSTRSCTQSSGPPSHRRSRSSPLTRSRRELRSPTPRSNLFWRVFSRMLILFFKFMYALRDFAPKGGQQQTSAPEIVLNVDGPSCTSRSNALQRNRADHKATLAFDRELRPDQVARGVA